MQAEQHCSQSSSQSQQQSQAEQANSQKFEFSPQPKQENSQRDYFTQNCATHRQFEPSVILDHWLSSLSKQYSKNYVQSLICRQFALHRYVSNLKIGAIKQFIKKEIPDQDLANRVNQTDYQLLIDPTKFEICNKRLADAQHLIIDCIRFIMKRNKARSKRCQLYNRFQWHQLSLISQIFKYNYYFGIILKQQSALICPNQISLMLSCSQFEISKLDSVFYSNIQNIQVFKLSKQFKETILLIIAIELKARIQKYSEKEQIPTEIQIVHSLNEIVKFFSMIDQNLKKRKINLTLTQVLKGEIGFCFMKEELKQTIEKELEQIITNSPKYPLDSQLLRHFSRKYYLKESNLARKYNTMKKLLQGQQKHTKRGSKVQQANNQNEILQKFSSSITLNNKNQTYNKRNEKKIENKQQYQEYEFELCYLSKIFKFIEARQRSTEVLFLGHIQFYRKEFECYNLKKGVECELQPRFDPIDNSLLHLITGITSRGKLYHSIVLMKLTYVDYLTVILQWLVSFQDKLPSTVVLSIPFNIRSNEMKVLRRIVCHLQKNKSVLIGVLILKDIPNPIKLLERYLKNKCFKLISDLIDHKEFIQILAILISRLLSKATSQMVKFCIKQQLKRSQHWLIAKQINKRQEVINHL